MREMKRSDLIDPTEFFVENLIGQALSQNRVYFNGEVMSRNPGSGAKSGADAAHWE